MGITGDRPDLPEHSGAIKHWRAYVSVASLCGVVALLMVIALDLVSWVDHRPWSAALNESFLHDGLFSIGFGCVAFAFWLQPTVGQRLLANRSAKLGWILRLAWIVIGIAASLCVIASIIGLAILLTPLPSNAVHSAAKTLLSIINSVNLVNIAWVAVVLLSGLRARLTHS